MLNQEFEFDFLVISNLLQVVGKGVIVQIWVWGFLIQGFGELWIDERDRSSIVKFWGKDDRSLNLGNEKVKWLFYFQIVFSEFEVLCKGYKCYEEIM